MRKGTEQERRDRYLLQIEYEQLYNKEVKPAEIKKSVLIELKGRRASLRQLERLTGIGKSMIYRMG